MYKRQQQVCICDCDGVLVDTVPALYGIYHAFLAHYGVSGTQTEFDTLNGPKLLDIVRILRQTHAIEASVEQMFERYDQALSDIYTHAVLQPGVQDMLACMQRRGIRLAVATASRRGALLALLDRCDLRKYFDYIVTGDDVEHAKPAPEIYEHVRTFFQTDTQSTHVTYSFYVIEDADHGMQAALAAHMYCIFYNPNNRASTQRPQASIRQLTAACAICAEQTYAIIATASDIQLTLDPSPHTYSEQQQQAIEDQWQQDHSVRGLTDAPIALLCQHQHQQFDQQAEQLTIHCRIGQYKTLYAHLCRPELGLGIAAIAVSAIVIDPHGYTLIAQRKQVTQYVGCYECVTAGSIDIALHDLEGTNVNTQLTTEFVEETGIASQHISSIEHLGVVRDLCAGGQYDVCARIRVDAPLHELIDAQHSHGNEYQRVEIVSWATVQTMLADSAHDWVPTSRALVAMHEQQ